MQGNVLGNGHRQMKGHSLYFKVHTNRNKDKGTEYDIKYYKTGRLKSKDK